MVLRVSVVLLFIFLTGGYSLKCYSCSSALTGSCKATVETCKDGFSECESSLFEQSAGSTKVFFTTKGCANQCEPGTKQLAIGGTVSTRCCDTDLCNAADGVFKGSFLLLFSPLLFYFLFQ
ncbi:prostate stem cell antigen-like isoform X1 [Megalobrama amblycephala]|uniref:prostate stem cell antigen-like isoform X1 n=1 Tax=Megalobrama amblycephala TaxID=75352 RepID=UPI0020147C51|nr:prostate stem cell antigen-like isoform X1 [Megalobrama amblycephala]XP_048036351.1 prostate stem cell antigen-like isoform X1 [Megalobrama amblycephala]